MRGDTGVNIPVRGEAEPLLVPLDDTVKILGGITLRELHKRFAAGDLEKVKLGRRSFVPRASIEAYVQRLRDEAAADRKAS